MLDASHMTRRLLTPVSCSLLVLRAAKHCTGRQANMLDVPRHFLFGMVYSQNHVGVSKCPRVRDVASRALCQHTHQRTGCLRDPGNIRLSISRCHLAELTPRDYFDVQLTNQCGNVGVGEDASVSVAA